jgi:hypothetical protein
MPTVTIYTLTLYDGSAGDWTEVHGSELAAVRALLDYIEDRCELYGHQVALMDGSESVCACELIRPGGGEIDPDGVRRVLEDWEHDCNGEGQGRWEGPEVHSVEVDSSAIQE